MFFKNQNKRFEKHYAYSTYFGCWIRAEKVRLHGWTFRKSTPEGTPIGPVMKADSSIGLFTWYPSIAKKSDE